MDPRGAEFDGWEDPAACRRDHLAALRQAEDEALVQRYVTGLGRGLDPRPIRAFVNHVRRDLGSEAVICGVEVVPTENGSETRVSYYFPPPEEPPTPASQPQTSVVDIPAADFGRVRHQAATNHAVSRGRLAPARPVTAVDATDDAASATSGRTAQV